MNENTTIAATPTDDNAKLNNDDVQSRLADTNGWVLEKDGAIRRTFEFETFLDAVAFVNRIAHAAESAQHHPDMDIRYNKVTIGLLTHDAGGLTAKDFALAQQVNEFF